MNFISYIFSHIYFLNIIYIIYININLIRKLKTKLKTFLIIVVKEIDDWHSYYDMFRLA